MPRTQRFVQYIQQLAYESLVRHEERDEPPEEVMRARSPPPSYATWNATSFASYVPFSAPTNN